MGLLGSLLGAGLGILLGQGTVRMVSQTINDLYFTTTVQANAISTLEPGQRPAAGGAGSPVDRLFPGLGAASVPRGMR